MQCPALYAIMGYMPKGIQGFQKGNKYWQHPNSIYYRFKKGLRPWNAKLDPNQKSAYIAIHQWLTRHYGKVDKCENIKCKKLSSFFQWALKRGKKYEYKREYFIKLCRKCHCRYDNWSSKMWATRDKREKRYKLNISQIKKICVALYKGKKQQELADIYGVHQSTISHIIQKYASCFR